MRFFRIRTVNISPCHETKFPERFNCLFCYCPLYALGRDCGGNFRYTESGIKDCSGCMIPHEKGKLWARDGGGFRTSARESASWTGKRIKTCPPQTLALR